jgi:phosphoglycolate phosphatase-like HAD superfamily hydrolase
MLAYRHWIFDLDGTLTVAVHDFEAIRAELGLPPGAPILEAIAQLPAAERSAMDKQLYEIELALARRTREQPGARALLAELHKRGARLGVLTRNATELAHITLEAADLGAFFPPGCVLGRDCCKPKPDPAGVYMLLELWNARADDTVLVGDFVFDLHAARNAKLARAIYFDHDQSGRFTQAADLSVTSLDELRALLT